MALRNQPYLPLYIQDFMTDEKLAECSAESTGVYIRLMCLLHKSDEYGCILLKQKDKQTDNQIKNFCLKIARHIAYPFDILERSIVQLLDEGVIHIDGDKLYQKRMVKDAYISETRARVGATGGKKTQSKNKKFALANGEASSESEDETDIDIEITDEDKKTKIPYEVIKSKYNEICKSYPQMMRMSDARKKAIHSRFVSGYMLDDFITLFEMAERSDFLKGKNNKNWSATFDWLICDSNMAKTLDGNYENNGKSMETGNMNTDFINKYRRNV